MIKLCGLFVLLVFIARFRPPPCLPPLVGRFVDKSVSIVENTECTSDLYDSYYPVF